MLTGEQLKIFSVVCKEPFRRFTFKEIKALSGQRSNNVVQIALGKFEKEEIVRVERTGNVKAYSLELDSGLALSYLNLIGEAELQEARKLPGQIRKAVDEIRERVSGETGFFILLVFGSHAEGKASSRSDLDVAVIVDNEEARNEVAPSMETVKRRSLVRIDYHVFTRKEFVEMLSSVQENLGKQIYRKSVIIHGRIEYYSRIKGLAHGQIG
ncbi:nucleotidyltransferase domain-containing protein [bacterium]|nr:nucleotidyltransferase domain-containing protein [bacterium]